MRDIEHYLLIKAKGENKIRSTCTKENSERGKHDPEIFITVKYIFIKFFQHYQNANFPSFLPKNYKKKKLDIFPILLYRKQKLVAISKKT